MYDIISARISGKFSKDISEKYFKTFLYNIKEFCNGNGLYSYTNSFQNSIRMSISSAKISLSQLPCGRQLKVYSFYENCNHYLKINSRFLWSLIKAKNNNTLTAQQLSSTPSLCICFNSSYQSSTSLPFVSINMIITSCSFLII